MTNRNKRISKTSTKKSSISESKVSTETYANLDELEVKERAKSKEFSKRIREAKSIQKNGMMSGVKLLKNWIRNKLSKRITL